MNRYEKFKEVFPKAKNFGIWSVAEFFVSTNRTGWYYLQHHCPEKTPHFDCAVLYEIDWLREVYVDGDNIFPQILTAQDKEILGIT